MVIFVYEIIIIIIIISPKNRSTSFVPPLEAGTTGYRLPFLEDVKQKEDKTTTLSRYLGTLERQVRCTIPQ